jgi:tetratricopeptide (TPR) repeat protein
MSKPKFYKITVTFVFVLIGVAAFYYYVNPKPRIDSDKHLEEYLSQLSKDPTNCHYLGQIAASYQALNNFYKAIDYYKQAVEYCPDNLLDLFQLGVSHYLIMERDNAIQYWDMAIEKAKKKSDNKLAEMFEKDKVAWLEKWDEVKTMNRIKIR